MNLVFRQLAYEREHLMKNLQNYMIHQCMRNYFIFVNMVEVRHDEI